MLFLLPSQQRQSMKGNHLYNSEVPSLNSHSVYVNESGQTAGPTYSAAGLVVVKVHEHARQFVGVSRVVLLFLARVDESDGEPVSVVGVVTAAAPDPVTA